MGPHILTEVVQKIVVLSLMPRIVPRSCSERILFFAALIATPRPPQHSRAPDRAWAVHQSRQVTQV